MNRERAKFIVYYREGDNFTCLNSDNSKFYTVPYTEINELYNNNCCFNLMSGYNLTKKCLKQFKKDFREWNRELVNISNQDRLYYMKLHSHHRAVGLILHRYSPLYRELYKKLPAIKFNEYTFMDNCFNGGLQYLDPQYKGKSINCYGYDYTSFYATNLTKIKIPINEGKELILKELPKNLKYGLYRVNIECSDPDINKVFSFSNNQTYTHYDLKWAQKLKRKYKFNIDINLIDDGEPNAYIYDEEDLIEGRAMFGNWYDKLIKLKKKYPKNRLAKHLLSSLWGILCKINKKLIKADDIDDVDLNNIKDFVPTESGGYYIIEQEERYTNSIARFKPFLTAYGRVKIGKTIIDNIKNLVRVHTDGIVFNTPINFNIEDLIPEEKTTGQIIWQHQNDYKEDEDFFNN